ncbi:hypothetical protein AYJ08_05970 [Brevibacillus sp. SKDU10]|uniref:hypothetical protein n=1 Tax=Brevibacillus sp. SKDU10 TaxID=1247872 RepID=UPI0007C8FE96|nr:hypothetical protein [Brevibacillus sp. SKDU10]OAJ75160.1 hypothetical protein AYJ08_05970 [Brevibacillus sp. SKDU10]
MANDNWLRSWDHLPKDDESSTPNDSHQDDDTTITMRLVLDQALEPGTSEDFRRVIKVDKLK